MKSQQALGELILSERKRTPHIPITTIADWAMREELPENPKNESIGTETAEVYKEHLREQGDKYSLEMLEHLTTGKELADDPGGN